MSLKSETSAVRPKPGVSDRFAAPAEVSLGRESNLWCVRAKPNPRATFRLICFPYAGASASIFGSWHRLLPENIEVCGIQLPGRQNRLSERPFTQVPSLVAALAEQLLPLLDLPFAFFGHSMGAIVSFEMARWLRRSNHLSPQILFVSGRRAPQIPDTDPPLHCMNHEDFLAGIRKLNGTPNDILASPDLLDLILPALRADTELCETYEYQSDAVLSCPITAFCGTADEQETASRMKEWKLQTMSKFSLHLLLGDHFFIHSNEVRLLELLRLELSALK